LKNEPHDSQKEKLKIQISHQKLIFNDQECNIVKIRDITASEKLKKVKDQNKLMGLMTASVSHEFLTPLKCISSFAEEIQSLIENP
jgi:signal transduction histidine kinase